MKKIADIADQEGMYMLGSTNIFQVGYAENCDATHPFNLRFYMPSDAIKLNKVNLNFKMDDFRAYNQAALSVNTTAIFLPIFTNSEI